MLFKWLPLSVKSILLSCFVMLEMVSLCWLAPWYFSNPERRGLKEGEGICHFTVLLPAPVSITPATDSSPSQHQLVPYIPYPSESLKQIQTSANWDASFSEFYILILWGSSSDFLMHQQQQNISPPEVWVSAPWGPFCVFPGSSDSNLAPLFSWL